MNFQDDYLELQILQQIPDYTIPMLAVFAILAIIFAPYLLQKSCGVLSIAIDHSVLVNGVRGFFAICLLFTAAVHPDSPVNATTPGFVRFLSVLFAFYLYYVLFFASGHFLRRHFGRTHCSAHADIMVDTYRSRGFTLTARIILSAVLIIIVVHTLEADDLLRTSGLIAALLVVIGLSQNAWAPDYIGGLLILYSEMFKEGDTIKIQEGNQVFFGEIYRIKAFHTEILSIVDNHRIIVRNSRMRDQTIHNLSKFASAKGLREMLSFKIGYEVPEKQIQAMFRSAFTLIQRNHSIAIERNHPPEISVHNTGDHAVEWSVFYYTKDTRKLIRTRQAITEVILNTSKKYNVSLATPLTHTMDVGNVLMGDQYSQPFAYDGRKGVAYGRNFSVPVFSE